MPNGIGKVMAAILTTMFSFMGTEIITIAAAESKNPGKQITQATNSVIWRIALFYLLSIFFVVALVPWNSPSLVEHGSYQTVLQAMNIPHAKLIVDVVVLIAVCSCLNSALYTSSRMLYSLSRRKDAPAAASRTTRSGTPWVAVLLSTAAAFVAVVANYLAPSVVFEFLLASSGAIALLVYLVIAFSHLVLRKKREKAGETLSYRMWLFPGLTWLTIAFIVTVLVCMLFNEQHQNELLATGGLTLVIIIASLLMPRRERQQQKARFYAVRSSENS